MFKFKYVSSKHTMLLAYMFVFQLMLEKLAALFDLLTLQDISPEKCHYST